MKVLIDIPEELHNEILHDEACGLNELTKAIAKGTPISGSATNGQVVDAIFTYEKTIDAKWWNAPYQKGGKE